MVKSLATALVCGCFLVAYASAQEVFVGDQQARPKYPKAQPAAEHAKPAVQADRVASVQTKKSEAPAKPTAAAVASKSESIATEKKNTLAATQKTTTKPEPKIANATVTKAVPAVVPGQRAPAATPSPVVRPETPMMAKSQTQAKLPAAAVPPLSRTAQAHVSSNAASAAPDVVTSPNKSGKLAENHAQSAVAQTKAPAPPAEGPTHVVVAKAKKSGTTVPPGRVASKALSAQKPTTPTVKAASGDDEDETAMSALVNTKPVVASSTVLKKTTPVMREVTDAHAMTTVPATLPTHRAFPLSTTKVSLTQSSDLESSAAPLSSESFETAFIKLADGFDFPVGRPEAQGYYKARGFRSHGHMGEDWDGVGGGDTDLGDPIYSIGDGLVVFARDCHMGWGNVVIVRHSYREGGTVKTVDSLYGHLQSMLVRKGQAVARGQKIATMGTAHGLYDAHLHLEVRKNIEIGMSRAAFAQDFSNYYDPSQFILTHRHLQSGGGSYRVALNTFTHDSRIRWDKVHNYSHAHTGGGSSESAAALKRALASKSSNNG